MRPTGLAPPWELHIGPPWQLPPHQPLGPAAARVRGIGRRGRWQQQQNRGGAEGRRTASRRLRRKRTAGRGLLISLRPLAPLTMNPQPWTCPLPHLPRLPDFPNHNPLILHLPHLPRCIRCVCVHTNRLQRPFLPDFPNHQPPDLDLPSASPAALRLVCLCPCHWAALPSPLALPRGWPGGPTQQSAAPAEGGGGRSRHSAHVVQAWKAQQACHEGTAAGSTPSSRALSACLSRARQ